MQYQILYISFTRRRKTAAKIVQVAQKLYCPVRVMAKLLFFAFVGEGDAAGVEHRGGKGVLCAVLMVADQGVAPAGKLHPDLVAASGMQPDTDQRGFSLGQSGKFKSGFFDTGPLPFDHKNLIPSAVLKKKIFPVAGFRGRSVDQGYIFFD